MRHYCAEASIYGNATQPATARLGKILVILNPIADKRSSSDTVRSFQMFSGFVYVLTFTYFVFVGL